MWLVPLLDLQSLKNWLVVTFFFGIRLHTLYLQIFRFLFFHDFKITDLFDELWETIPDLCDNGKWQSIIGLINASVIYEEKQKGLVKKIRQCFFCAKKSQRSIFIPMVFTMRLAKIEQG